MFSGAHFSSRDNPSWSNASFVNFMTSQRKSKNEEPSFFQRRKSEQLKAEEAQRLLNRLGTGYMRENYNSYGNTSYTAVPDLQS